MAMIGVNEFGSILFLPNIYRAYSSYAIVFSQSNREPFQLEHWVLICMHSRLLELIFLGYIRILSRKQ